MPDIEFAVGAAGIYTVFFKDKQNPSGVNVTGFTGGTIIFASKDARQTSLGSATMVNFGTPDNFSAQFTIPPSHSMTVGANSYKDYIAQIELTGSGNRLTFEMSMRLHKKLGDST